MISKELLSLVLGEEVKDVTFEDLFLSCSYDDIKGINWTTVNRPNSLQVMPQDTLCRLCKEWCEDKGYNVKSWFDRCHSPLRQVGIASIEDVIFRHYFGQNESELGAVIKATEWAATEKGLL